MSIPTLVPAADRAPSLASRVVTIHATDVTEGAPAPDSFEFSLACALRVPSDDVILRPGGVKVRLVDGRASIRLPVYDPAVQTIDGSTDWVIRVAPSWGHPYGIRVPAGTSSISLADLPNVRPLTRREQAYAITSVGVTVTEGTQAGGSASYTNGNLDLKIQVPSFRPETVYPYIDQTADARAQHYEEGVRADLDARLAEVTNTYELYVQTTADNPVMTLEQWMASLVGPEGPASTVPGPPNVLTIGDVSTGAPGSAAGATITGTSPQQVLGLAIPQGPQGDRGPAGEVQVDRPAPGQWDIVSQPTTIAVADVEGLAARLAVLEPKELGTVHLDTVSTPGRYYQPFASRATKAQGYPWEGVAGNLEVEVWNPSNGNLIVTFKSWDRGIAKRTLYLGTWRAWLDPLGNPIP